MVAVMNIQQAVARFGFTFNTLRIEVKFGNCESLGGIVDFTSAVPG
jgi:hypothetical protein